ncbi:hypothetical protein [Aurantiacibacter gilvus]|uniref:Uncharacterized protein n=1 Tax=Aurantiacibacter gilvus TaxID=3139141 RepID=A0ABU9ID96_9SPHN
MRGPRELLADAQLALADGPARIVRHEEKSWASITFAGSRHRVELAFEGAEAVEAGECFIVFLPEHEFTIRGQLVADAAVVEVESVAAPPKLTVTCEILLLEES